MFHLISFFYFNFIMSIKENDFLQFSQIFFKKKKDSIFHFYAHEKKRKIFLFLKKVVYNFFYINLKQITLKNHFLWNEK